MNRKFVTNFVIVSTFYTVEGEICNVQCIGNVFPTQDKARKWLTSAKGEDGLLKKCDGYASKNGVSIKMSAINSEETSYCLDMIDGDDKYPIIQYDIIPIKHKDMKGGKSCETV